MGGGEGEGEMYGESNIETYNTIRKIDSQWEFAARLRVTQIGALWQAEGWDEKRDGKEVWEGGDMGITMADSCWCMTENHKILKAIILQLKNLKKKAEGQRIDAFKLWC